MAVRGSMGVDAIIRALGSSDASEAAPFGSLLSRLAPALGLDALAVFEFDTSDFGYAIGRSAVHGFEGDLVEEVRPHVDGRYVPFALYNPVCPEPEQRNQAVLVHTVDGGALYMQDEPPRSARPVAAARALHDRFAVRCQLRALVCDGPVLLAWVGGMSDRPIDVRARERLQQIVPALARRLAADRRKPDDLGPAALEVALEALPAAAFVTAPCGLVLHANAAAIAMLERDHRFGAHLADVVSGRCADPRFRVTRFRPNGMAEHALVTHVPDVPCAADRVAAARRAWGLTARQTEVLALLVRGEPNKHVAAILGCAERTIELHVTALLAKAGVDNRAALVARFWAP